MKLTEKNKLKLIFIPYSQQFNGKEQLWAMMKNLYIVKIS